MAAESRVSPGGCPGRGAATRPVTAPGPVVAVLDPVAADLHLTPGAAAIAGGVEEGPAALVAGADLEARPGGVELRLKGDADQLRDQIVDARHRIDVEGHLAVGADLHGDRVVGGQAAERLVRLTILLAAQVRVHEAADQGPELDQLPQPRLVDDEVVGRQVGVDQPVAGRLRIEQQFLVLLE